MNLTRSLSALKVSPAGVAVLGAVLVLAPLYVWLVWSPLAARLEAARAQAETQEARIGEFARLSAVFRPAGPAEEAAWEETRRTFERAVPEAPDSLGLIARVSLAARAAGINDAGFKAVPEGARAPAGFAARAVEVSFHATYRQLARLLAGLGASMQPLGVEAMEVGRDEAGLAVKLTVVGYSLGRGTCSATATS